MQVLDSGTERDHRYDASPEHKEVCESCAAESERRRQRALALHQKKVVDPETGEERAAFGGAQPGSGRPRKPRVSEAITEEMQKRQAEIVEALFDGLDKDQPQYIRQQAVRDLLAIEQKEFEITREEERELERLHRDELIQRVSELFDRLGPDGANILKHPIIEHQPRVPAGVLEAGNGGSSPAS